jgi:gluconolactonase
LFYITPEGTLRKASEDVTSPNGVQLSVDEKTLYATNGTHILAFDVKADGILVNPRRFAETGGDGLAVDDTDRLYAATRDGIRVVGGAGEILGTIPTPVGMQSVGFAGPGKRTLYAAGRGAVYQVSMISAGISTRAK